jgi:hypothetical protein
VLKVAQSRQAVIGGKGGDRRDIHEKVRPAGEVIVEVGVCIGDDTDGKVDARNSLKDLIICRSVVNIRRVYGT